MKLQQIYVCVGRLASHETKQNVRACLLTLLKSLFTEVEIRLRLWQVRGPLWNHNLSVENLFTLNLLSAGLTLNLFHGDWKLVLITSQVDSFIFNSKVFSTELLLWYDNPITWDFPVSVICMPHYLHVAFVIISGGYSSLLARVCAGINCLAKAQLRDYIHAISNFKLKKFPIPHNLFFKENKN